MKASELRDKSVSEIKALIIERRREQFNLRMQRGSGQQARGSQICATRRDIARMKTIINEKQKGGA